MDRKLDRRRFVQITGAAGLGALAGCLGDDEPAAENGDENGMENGDESENGPEEEETEEDIPDPTATDNALIEPATLKEWQDVGLVNLGQLDVRERVVVLRVWDTETYDDGHVPGALKWGPNEFHAARVEGLGEVAPMVPNGAQMDAVLQRSGVCPKTTIVLSGLSSPWTARPTRRAVRDVYRPTLNNDDRLARSSSATTYSSTTTRDDETVATFDEVRRGGGLEGCRRDRIPRLRPRGRRGR
ncbi:hypothetical protein ACFQL3_02465 [Natronoarchaeum sp. GCM10025321]|uniref:hypothetical protein n=1 Tax=Natronoarchaeum sp. GCM10025321 TaxID=3252684 RepID=UPI00360F638E